MDEWSGWFTIAGIIGVVLVLGGAMAVVRAMRGKRPVSRPHDHER